MFRTNERQPEINGTNVVYLQQYYNFSSLYFLCHFLRMFLHNMFNQSILIQQTQLLLESLDPGAESQYIHMYTHYVFF